ncbi:hypothetical protein L249_0770 [Ophiocordyceps polyrhachis-furcata BCC 54312]|uniref:Uncharacterized protein n=1 Tax=Ophiocordyceps polyrhachis-furcata BCC 54312 TaxID=1330021 RepID=A0A367LCM2_9HYPO|nr:hypothetical protein L249_0770 [Ophiocordyceps polyrhachis-furcata BCC 54312]
MFSYVQPCHHSTSFLFPLSLVLEKRHVFFFFEAYSVSVFYDVYARFYFMYHLNGQNATPTPPSFLFFSFLSLTADMSRRGR